MAGYGWARDVANDRLDIEVAGTTVAQLTTTAFTLPTLVGLTITNGSLAITAGGLTVTAGRMRETLTRVNVDSRHATLSAATVKSGILVHTTEVGGGNVTMDTAANYIANIPLTENGQTAICYYMNDGNQTATFAIATGSTIAHVGQTVATNQGSIVMIRRTSGTACVLYHV